MPIDFHAAANANTYASRNAYPDWLVHMQSLLDGRQPGTVADIGCGGGIYSRAWRTLGAETVVGLDSSAQMVADAESSSKDTAIRFAVASAYETGLADASCDVVFSRAVVHHLNDHPAAFAEAFRILRPGGMVIVQDRTIEDVLQPASPEHFRAHFFSEYPQLLEDERKRRPVTDTFRTVLIEAGFAQLMLETFWETRQTYHTPEELRTDLLARTGRSILHNLTDSELASLTEAILQASGDNFPLEERDRWTMWAAIKPATR